MIRHIILAKAGATAQGESETGNRSRIEVDPQTSSTADKAEYSILALDSRYDFLVTLWSGINPVA